MLYVARTDFARDHALLLETVLDAFSTLSNWAASHPKEAAQLTFVKIQVVSQSIDTNAAYLAAAGFKQQRPWGRGAYCAGRGGQ